MVKEDLRSLRPFREAEEQALVRQYRILSWQTEEAGRAIYCLLPDKEQSVRIVTEKQAWKLDDVVVLDEAFVEANREI